MSMKLLHTKTARYGVPACTLQKLVQHNYTRNKMLQMVDTGLHFLRATSQKQKIQLPQFVPINFKGGHTM